jgi:hypothetical protein
MEGVLNVTISAHLKQALEVRHSEDIFDIGRTILNRDIRGISAQVFAHHQQHAQCGTIHVIGTTHINGKTRLIAGAGIVITITKFILHGKIKTTTDIYGDGIVIC